MLLFLGWLCFPNFVEAEMCDANYLKNLNELADNVYVSYEYVDNKFDLYHDLNGNFKMPDEVVSDRYFVNVDLISDDLYLVLAGKKYYYEAWSDKGIFLVVGSGKLELDIHSSKCWDKKIKTIRLDLPKFNVYSYRDECKIVADKELEVCDPWYQGNITDESFLEVIDEYLPKEKSAMVKILDFISHNIFYIVLGILIIVGGIVSIVIYRKKSILD
jgi:hypothetical protein